MFRLVREARFAARTLARSRFVTSLAILAFALGIGVTSAVFSIFNGVLLKPLPFPDAEELVSVYDTQPACATCPASYPKYMDWKTRNTVFAAIGGSMQLSLTLTGAGDPIRVPGVATTASLVDVFGVPPMIGRWYTEQEDQFGGPQVVVLSHEIWTRQFNADPTVVGRRLTFDGKPYEVIGVMPATFSHRRAQFYVPLQRKLDPATRNSHFMPTYARLKKGITFEQATAEMRALGQTLAAEFGNNHGVDVRSYYEVLVGSVRSSLWLLMGAVLLVLLIACANVANLLLAAGMARRREFAIRMALGAGRGALARQLATESLLARVRRRCTWHPARTLDGRRLRRACRQPAAARNGDRDRRARTRVHRHHLAFRWRGLRRVAPATTAAARPDERRARRRYADGECRRQATRQRSGRRRDRHRLRAARRRRSARQEPVAPHGARCRHSHRNGSCRSTWLPPVHGMRHPSRSWPSTTSSTRV